MIKPFDPLRNISDDDHHSPSDPTNGERAKRAGRVLAFYKYEMLGEAGPVDSDPTITDLLTDIMHWCHQRRGGPTDHETVFMQLNEHLQSAITHFVEETGQMEDEDL
ncbi:MAG: hypothetical protein QOF48_3729 [Verrucomicrobiota bacterium]